MTRSNMRTPTFTWHRCYVVSIRWCHDEFFFLRFFAIRSQPARFVRSRKWNLNFCVLFRGFRVLCFDYLHLLIATIWFGLDFHERAREAWVILLGARVDAATLFRWKFTFVSISSQRRVVDDETLTFTSSAKSERETIEHRKKSLDIPSVQTENDRQCAKSFGVGEGEHNTYWRTRRRNKNLSNLHSNNLSAD